VFSVRDIEYGANKLVYSLKTRERYVQISEDKLRDKKKHCRPDSNHHLYAY
jgi:hypothetical protein